MRFVEIAPGITPESQPFCARSSSRLRRADLRRREIGCLLAFEHLSLRFDGGAFEPDDEPVERGFFACVLASQAGTVDGGEHLPFGHRIAGFHGERHRPDGRRKECRTVRDDDRALRGDVADEGAT